MRLLAWPMPSHYLRNKWASTTEWEWEVHMFQLLLNVVEDPSFFTSLFEDVTKVFGWLLSIYSCSMRSHTFWYTCKIDRNQCILLKWWKKVKNGRNLILVCMCLCFFFSSLILFFEIKVHPQIKWVKGKKEMEAKKKHIIKLFPPNYIQKERE